MNALSAIELVLSEAKHPLSAKDITDLILSKKYWATAGKTPWDTVSALLSVDIKSKAVNSKFQRTAPNLFALRSWGLSEYIRQSKKDENTIEDVAFLITTILFWMAKFTCITHGCTHSLAVSCELFVYWTTLKVSLGSLL